MNLLKMNEDNKTRKAFWLSVWESDCKRLNWENAPRVQAAWWQLEAGEKNGTLHWQCYVECDESTRYTGIAKKIGVSKGKFRAGTLKYEKDRAKMKNYCRKVETRVRGPFHYRRKEPYKQYKFESWKSDRVNLMGLLENKMQEIKYWKDFLDRNRPNDL